ncbi:MAG: hypothetical protein GYB64_01565 [Chloroflexi bacterium]|nr:hypothetical protein [Chloroflexota bacterium]
MSRWTPGEVGLTPGVVARILASHPAGRVSPNLQARFSRCPARRNGVGLTVDHLSGR